MQKADVTEEKNVEAPKKDFPLVQNQRTFIILKHQQILLNVTFKSVLRNFKNVKESKTIL